MLDEGAFDELLAREPDAALALLAEMTGAVDPLLRRLAGRLASRVVPRLVGVAARQGRGRSRLGPGSAVRGGDLDLDASMESIVQAATGGRPPRLDELVAIDWRRTTTAVAVIVDSSGSMGGNRLSTAALAAATVAARMPDDHCVLAFAAGVTVIRSFDEPRSIAAVIDDLLSLRGHGSTDLTLALEEGARQLERSAARRRVAVLLSDCQHNGAGDPVIAGRRFDDLVVLSVAADDADAADAMRFAAAVGGRCARVRGPSEVAGALTALLA